MTKRGAGFAHPRRKGQIQIYVRKDALLEMMRTKSSQKQT